VSSGPLSGLNSKYIISSTMKFILSYFAALYSCLLLTLEGKFPALSKRRALSTTIATLVLLVVIALGALVIYLIAVSPGAKTTTYP